MGWLVSAVTLRGDTLKTATCEGIDSALSGAVVVSPVQAATTARVASMAQSRETASLRASLNVYVIDSALSRLSLHGPNHSRNSTTALGLNRIYGKSRPSSTTRFMTVGYYSFLVICVIALVVCELSWLKNGNCNNFSGKSLTVTGTICTPARPRSSPNRAPTAPLHGRAHASRDRHSIGTF